MLISESHPSQLAWWELVEECRDGDVECFGNLQNAEESGIAFATLDATHMVEMHARGKGERLLESRRYFRSRRAGGGA